VRELEFALTLQNLLHGSHLEFGSPTHRGRIERNIHGSVVWRPQGR
jgi:hypothetical protein